MAGRSHSGAGKRSGRQTRPRRNPLAMSVRRLAETVRHVLKAFWAAPPSVRIILVAVFVVGGWYTTNWMYQTARKPTELLAPLGGRLDKSPVETWTHYGALFREHATEVVTAELLAALAQVEGGGNPLAQTYWEWRWTWNPYEMYRPASSAVGMYQITDGTFEQARRLCIHDHAVVEDGPWHDWRSCWFTGLYTRTLPTHAIEMTSAWLDRQVTGIITRRRRTQASLKQQQNLAAIIHLCGATAGDGYARRGFRLSPGQRCGDHNAKIYLARVNALKRQFARLAGTS